MNYKSYEHGNFTVIQLEGEIDLSNSSEVRDAVLDVLSKKRNLVVDLEAVSYIDSSGIASLVEGYQTAKDKNLEFGLANISEVALDVLQLAHLDKVFPIRASAKDYLQP